MMKYFYSNTMIQINIVVIQIVKLARVLLNLNAFPVLITFFIILNKFLGKENYLYNGECIGDCPDYYYDFKDNNTCMACHETCKSCTTSSSDNCSACIDGLVLVLVEDETVGTCICEGNCLTCENSTTTCTSC